jgi:hypothetical protein
MGKIGVTYIVLLLLKFNGAFSLSYQIRTPSHGIANRRLVER